LVGDKIGNDAMLGNFSQSKKKSNQLAGNDLQVMKNSHQKYSEK
jgi:hypothetical protein